MLKYLCPALCTVLYRPSLAASNATAYITWSPDMPLCRDSDRLPLSHLQWICAGMLTMMPPDGRGAASRVHHLDRCCIRKNYMIQPQYIVDALYGKLNDVMVLHPKSYNMYHCVGGCKSTRPECWTSSHAWHRYILKTTSVANPLVNQPACVPTNLKDTIVIFRFGTAYNNFTYTIKKWKNAVAEECGCRWWYDWWFGLTALTRLNPRPVRGVVDATPPPWVFLSWTPHRLENRAEIFHSLWGILCATFGEKNLVGSGQVTKLWRHKRNNLRKISAKSWVNATWRGAIDVNGDSWWDWCQYMTGCDPWHCARWGSRSTKVTWGHWPRLNSQWQITNRHMFSGVSWGAESESVVHCP